MASRETVLNALRGEIAPVQRSPAYLLGIALAAVIMLLLPLLYLALVAGAAYGVYYHATHNVWLLDAVGGGRGRIYVALVAYIGPLLVGGVLVLFMIKPLFARSLPSPGSLALKRDEQPLLFDYVDRLCEIVRAPQPRSIHVDCSVNASASLGSGLRNLFRRDLRLTVGLPLVSGLTLSELTGVLAHEFGHFSQGVGMRFTAIIGGVQNWFDRVIHERDEWDQWLLEVHERYDFWYVALFSFATRFCVWVSRLILRLLSLVGALFVGFLSRRMEFDADRYEIRVGGSQTFVSTTNKLGQLGFAARMVEYRLDEFWRNRILPDDYPALIRSEYDQFSAKARDEIQELLGGQRGGWFDTHPPDRQRIHAAERQAEPGIIELKASASVLFTHFGQLCRRVTFLYFKAMLGDEVDRRNLKPTRELRAEADAAQAESAAVEVYLGHAPCPTRPLLPETDGVPAPAAPKKTLAVLREAHRRVSGARQKVEKAYARYDQAVRRRVHAAVAETCIKAKVVLDPKDFDLSAWTSAAVVDAQRKASYERSLAEKVIVAYEKVARKRLASALQLLNVPEVQQRVQGAEHLLAEAKRLLTALVALREVFAEIVDFRTNVLELMAALQVLSKNAENGTMQSICNARMDHLRAFLKQVRESMRSEPYPFPHARANMTIGQYLLELPPSENDLGLFLNALGTFEDNLYALYDRAIRRLATIATAVETAVGLEPSKRATDVRAVDPEAERSKLPI